MINNGNGRYSEKVEGLLRLMRFPTKMCLISNILLFSGIFIAISK